MSLTTRQDCMASNPVRPEADLQKWGKLTMPAWVDSANEEYWNEFYLGLFGHDLLEFFKDCITVGDEYCDYTKYSTTYDGWAIGSYMYVSYTNAFDMMMEGICLPDYTCHGFYVEYTSGYGITDNFYRFYALAFESDGNEFKTNNPPMSQNYSTYIKDETTYEYIYSGFNSKLFYTQATTWYELSEGIFFFRFQPIEPKTPSADDPIRYEREDLLEVWTFNTMGNINKKNVDFEMKGATALQTALASALLLTSLTH